MHLSHCVPSCIMMSAPMLYSVDVHQNERGKETAVSHKKKRLTWDLKLWTGSIRGWVWHSGTSFKLCPATLLWCVVSVLSGYICYVRSLYIDCLLFQFKILNLVTAKYLTSLTVNLSCHRIWVEAKPLHLQTQTTLNAEHETIPWMYVSRTYWKRWQKWTF